MPKTKKIPPGGRVVTRAELTFFANACEAMMNAKIEQLRQELAEPRLSDDAEAMLASYRDELEAFRNAVQEAMPPVAITEKVSGDPRAFWHSVREALTAAATVPTDSEGAE